MASPGTGLVVRYSIASRHSTHFSPKCLVVCLVITRASIYFCIVQRNPEDEFLFPMMAFWPCLLPILLKAEPSVLPLSACMSSIILSLPSALQRISPHGNRSISMSYGCPCEIKGLAPHPDSVNVSKLHWSLGITAALIGLYSKMVVNRNSPYLEVLVRVHQPILQGPVCEWWVH